MMSPKLSIWSRDNGRIVIHGGVDVLNVGYLKHISEDQGNIKQNF